MTREEASEILSDKEITCLIGKFHGAKEALDVALSALRPITREQMGKILSKWEPCEFCGEWIGGDCTPKEEDVGYKIYAGYTKQVSVDDFWEDETENLNFCPICGRPFTDEAVETIMKRMEEMRND